MIIKINEIPNNFLIGRGITHFEQSRYEIYTVNKEFLTYMCENAGYRLRRIDQTIWSDFYMLFKKGVIFSEKVQYVFQRPICFHEINISDDSNMIEKIIDLELSYVNSENILNYLNYRKIQLERKLRFCTNLKIGVMSLEVLIKSIKVYEKIINDILHI